MQHGNVAIRTVPAETKRQKQSRAQNFEHIFDGYNATNGYSEAFDEMFDGHGNVRMTVE